MCGGTIDAGWRAAIEFLHFTPELQEAKADTAERVTKVQAKAAAKAAKAAAKAAADANAEKAKKVAPPMEFCLYCYNTVQDLALTRHTGTL